MCCLRLPTSGLWDLHPLNLFRISWHNRTDQPTEVDSAGVNYVEWPSALTGRRRPHHHACQAKWFPTGSHQGGGRVRLSGAAFGDRTVQSGDSESGVAIYRELLPWRRLRLEPIWDANQSPSLPEGMSRERFEWLETVAGEIIKTVGTESNVKEIFDKCNELRASG